MTSGVANLVGRLIRVSGKPYFLVDLSPIFEAGSKHRIVTEKPRPMVNKDSTGP